MMRAKSSNTDETDETDEQNEVFMVASGRERTTNP
jgi:hypothetical protein